MLPERDGEGLSPFPKIVCDAALRRDTNDGCWWRVSEQVNRYKPTSSGSLTPETYLRALNQPLLWRKLGFAGRREHVYRRTA